jgi:hypothetical protein
MAKPIISPVMKKLLAGYLTIFTLLAGTLVGLKLVDDSQDLQQQASTSNVDLIINAPTSVTRGQTFNVDVVVVRTNNHPVSAADIRLNLPSTHFTINSITPGPFFNRRSSMQVQPPGTDPAIRFPNVTETNRIAIGALCDYCYLGPSPLPTYQPKSPTPTVKPCGTVTNPACYPQTAGNLVLATYSVTVRADAPTGTVTLAFDTTNTQIASTNSDVNVVGDMTSTTTTIASTTTPTPTPTGTTNKCGGADISADGVTFGQDGRVSAADYNYLITKWSGFNTCANNNCGGADISADGVTFGQDGRVSAADYNYLITKWSGFNACQ